MSAPVSTAVASLRVFLGHLIDYAGLFAPASLDMMTSVKHYSRYLHHPQRWALGRFVLPVARLEEFLNTQDNVEADPWQLSGIISPNIEKDLDAVGEFNRKSPGAVIDAVEVRVSNLNEIDLVGKHKPAGTTVFFEFPPKRADEFLPVLRHTGCCAKVRTGGVVAEAFPAVEQIVEFIVRCAEFGVPFKATAGLHHPVRCARPLTYEPNSPEGTMHGFLNLFTAAAIAWGAVRSGREVPRAAIASCLADEERANWHFGDDSLTWSGRGEPMRINLEGLRSMRSKFALSFGACSFEEPIQDMRDFGLL
jgi:hypothetical protein